MSTKTNMVAPPEGVVGEGFFATKLNDVVGLARANSLWPLPFATSCCGIEFMATMASHYDLASAMIKSLRGSNIDAALYYMARLIDGGESVDFITRRFVIFASEDIGNANPNALNLASSTMQVCNKIGYPESRIILAQCAIYLASSPKSNSAYKAINKALEEIKNGKILDIPKHLDSQHIGYLYPHDFGGYVEQEYLKEDLKLYNSLDIGFEKTLSEWIRKIKNEN